MDEHPMSEAVDFGHLLTVLFAAAIPGIDKETAYDTLMDWLETIEDGTVTEAKTKRTGRLLAKSMVVIKSKATH